MGLNVLSKNASRLSLIAACSNYCIGLPHGITQKIIKRQSSIFWTERGRSAEVWNMEQDQGTTPNSPKQKSRKRRWLFLILCLPLVLLLFLIAADMYVGASSRNRLYHRIEDVPHRRAALVLGCGKYTQGRPNLYYTYRIHAAVELWQAGKIDCVVVSGDNSRKDYDEPSAMKADLAEKGVPAEYITLDYAGFRTLDSVIRAKQVFGLDDYVIVSQPFHCRRAIYLARRQGQSVIGYCAQDVAGASGAKVRLREVLARTKAVADTLLAKPPKFLGKTEQVHYREPEKGDL